MPSSSRPCSICRKWFTPSARVSGRQFACSAPSCQSARRKKKQAAWRAAHPDYFVARRLQERAAGTEEPRQHEPPARASSVSDVVTRPPEPLAVRPPLDRLPWDLAQSHFGVQGADFIAVLGGLLLRATQSQMRGQVPGKTGKADGLPPLAPQSQSKAPAS